MEAAKTERTKKARLVTRRMNEMLNCLKTEPLVTEVKEKIDTLKYAIGELGDIQDEVMSHIHDEDAQGIQDEETWYFNYDSKVNVAIKEGLTYVNLNTKTINTETVENVHTSMRGKLKKLEVPVFTSDHRNYYKWKEQFERYTRTLDDETRYDYLYTYTKGEAHEIIRNKQVYSEAIKGLDKEFGNTTYTMKLLIDDVRSMQMVRKGDHRAFEKLSREVNGFRERLYILGKGQDVENTYVLQEIEGKMNNEDKHKWYEHMGENIDTRKVEDLCQWLESQAHLRRLISSQRPRPMDIDNWNNRNRSSRVLSNTASSNEHERCALCGLENHFIGDCPQYLRNTNEEKWEHVKRLKLCFVCLLPEHRGFQCESSKCPVCQRLHHQLLHRWTRRNVTSKTPS